MPAGISITLSDIDHSSLTCKHQDYVANIVDSQFGYCSVFGKEIVNKATIIMDN